MSSHDVKCDLCMSRIISCSEDHGHILLGTFAAEGCLCEVGRHGEEIDLAGILGHKDGGKFGVSYVYCGNCEVSQFAVHRFHIFVVCFKGLLAVDLKYNVCQIQFLNQFACLLCIFKAYYLAGRCYSLLGLCLTKQSGLACAHDYYGVSGLGVYCDLSGSSGYVHDGQ